MTNVGGKDVLTESDQAFKARGVDVMKYENRRNMSGTMFELQSKRKPLVELLGDAIAAKGDIAAAHFEYAVECYGQERVDHILKLKFGREAA